MATNYHEKVTNSCVRMHLLAIKTNSSHTIGLTSVVLVVLGLVVCCNTKDVETKEEGEDDFCEEGLHGVVPHTNGAGAVGRPDDSAE